MTKRGVSWAAMAAGVLVLTAGCSGTAGSGGTASPSPSPTATAAAATPAPTPTPTATPTPTPAADPLAAVDTIVFTAAALSLREGGAEIGSVPLVGEPLDDAVAVLTRVLGQPEPDGVLRDHCVKAQTRWAWDELRLGTADLYTDEGTLSFRVETPTVTAADGHEVRVETPGGVAVGEPIGPLVAAVPVDQHDTFDPAGTGHISVVFDLVRTRESHGEMFPHGAIAWGDEGVVRGLGGPAELKDQC